MREVLVSKIVMDKVFELKSYLLDDLKLSEEAALKRTDRIDRFITRLGALVDYPLCRFEKWRMLGYHCAVFEKDWVFAYELFDNGIIIRDMSHTKLLQE